MKILVIGSGGREHALVWKIAQSPKIKKIYCAPGNLGIADMAKCLSISSGDINKILEFTKKEKIDLTIVGPEKPLCKGIVDIFEKENLKIFGANQKASELESSKSFAKYLLKKYGINTANGKTFNNYKKAENYILKMGAPIVVKVDGLAAGKGVFVCKTIAKAIHALNLIIKQQAFGEAGNKVVIEEFLTGEEASFIAFTDGKTLLPLPSSQDHKAIYENDHGPNTGGMGAYSPAPIVDRYMYEKIIEQIMTPTIKAMASEGRPYKGVLYAGLMINNDQIKVLEFNARFGDPEAQSLLMRIKNDIVPIMEATINGTLDKCKLEIDDRASACVIMASKGYPGSYKKGSPILGLQDVKRMKEVVVFHAGTDKKEDTIVTKGGRVLGVTALGNSIKKAISKAYSAVAKITWDGVYYRSDIGQKALKRIEQSPKVGIVMGSDSDYKVMEETVAALKKFGIPFEITVASAHRSPKKAYEFAHSAQKRGFKVIIAGAGHAAHLAGMISAHTSLPVIGIPIDSSVLQGIDSLLSTVQMPPGIPVATMAIGKSGARNAGILAAQILATSDAELNKILDNYKKEMSAKVEEKASKLKGRI